MRHNSMRPVTKLDLSDPGVWHREVPREEFSRLRREAPVAWNERFDGHRGFWAVSRYDDIVEVSRNTALYSSRNGVISLDDFDDAQNEARRTLLEMDPPQHTAMRQITRNAFGAKEISHLESAVRATAGRLVEEALEEGGVDIVAKIAKQLPIRTLCRLMGVPETRRDDMIRWSDLLIGSDDADFIDPAYAAVPQAERRLLPFGHPASLEAFELGLELAAARCKSGERDIVTVLAQGIVEGRPLTESEFCNYFLMLVVAGNETTRHSISHGIKALADNPGEWDRFRRGGIDSKVAANEIIRWATPVHFVRRIATEDTELSGARISAGDKVAMYYASGNRDEAHFEDPDRFIIDRAPNPHMAFGKGGPHFCLGNNVAQLQIRILLEEMSKRVAAFELTGPMDRLRSNHVHGVKRLPARLIPAGHD
jgi:cytochrome P450